MAGSTERVRADAYEAMGAAYHCALIALLAGALRRHLESAEARREVAERFAFGLGEFRDTGWLRPPRGANPVYPDPCFSERFLVVDTAPAGLGTVHAPSPGFAFREHAHGGVGAYYDGDPAAVVETGSYSDDES